MKKFNLIFLVCAVLFIGCAHYVEFKSPDTEKYETTIPLKAVFYMDNAMKSKIWSGRSAGAGIANRWDVPVGGAVQRYADAYLKNGFKEFNETEALPVKQIHDILIKVTNINYNMAGQAAHCDLTFTIENSSGKEVFNKTYHADGPSGYGRVFAGGAFAQKSAIRQSTHVVMETIFKSLLEDIRKNYTGWQ
ncbi:MAG: hypothetical protein A3G39_01885 [Deltaproteobacteria bacterium RIFCSPLOWO2_12_FULL_43_16]|nr:MAG: hypothetical protein A2Z89_08190 [Deltaproteobacteria bacterium GWA2_43_19]OGQ35616.1 MAG: hypothetical protein A3A85_02640 [Deltaproteobacteria bacterium RIFCSPLOWO2_01_FULL_42_9]OGQ57711.1 MAG: hypothetical protein A3G39_01885 [Deltaproteobacteria bacterium RIFCSPLOWO2_12_FULL_43_16]HBR18284.1 hypothetical protein [Deltaproteobacteria bacterium]